MKLKWSPFAILNGLNLWVENILCATDLYVCNISNGRCILKRGLDTQKIWPACLYYNPWSCLFLSFHFIVLFICVTQIKKCALRLYFKRIETLYFTTMCHSLSHFVETVDQNEFLEICKEKYKIFSQYFCWIGNRISRFLWGRVLLWRHTCQTPSMLYLI